MLIDTPEKTYRILFLLKEDLSLRMYLAADRKWDRKEKHAPRYLLTEFVNPVLGREMMLYLMGAGEECGPEDGGDRMYGKTYAERSWTVVTCFVRRGIIWLVSPYYEGCSFQEAARNACTARERSALWEGLLACLFYERLPLYLKYEAAAPVNIVVDEHSAVRINYELQETARLQELLSGKQYGTGGGREALFRDIQRRLYESFCILFSDHLTNADKKRRKDAVSEYAERLREGSYESGPVLCREFYGLRTGLLEQEREQSGQEQGVLLHFWNAVSGHADRIWKCVYCLLVLGLWALFLYLHLRPDSAAAQRTRITMIGTEEMDGGTMETVEETVETDG